MMRVRIQKKPRLCQGDVLRDVECIEYVVEKNGNIEISKINFPLVFVLTQDCDLAQDHTFRSGRQVKKTQDKFLLSVLVAPLYNVEHVYIGEHLSEISMKMTPINRAKSPGENLRKNETPRYHYLEFPTNIPVPPSVIDFKHYFAVNVSHLKKLKTKNFVCQVSDLYREDISQRFASFLSRIGLP
jgi:hypothetical protein